MSNFNLGWQIKVGNLVDPIKFTNQPKLVHSTAKAATNFSFDIAGRPFLPWSVTEKAKVEVFYSGEGIFIGNITSRSTDWDNFITSYNATGYYTHTRRNSIIGKFNNPFSTIINQLLDESGARPFISNISYKLGNIANSETSILDITLERQYTGQYLDSCLDDLCKAVGCQWFIDPTTGFLVLWQYNQIVSNREIDVEINRLGQCQQFKHDSVKPNFIFPEITRVVVAKDSESLLNRNVPQLDSTNNYLILSNSPENQVDLLKKTNMVREYFITPNPTQPLCNLTIDPQSSTFAKEGGLGSFNVIDGNDCSWMATSQASWVTLTGNTSGNGNGLVEFSVESNPFTRSRNGSILVEGEQTQAIHQISQIGDPEGIPQGCDAVYFSYPQSESRVETPPDLTVNSINIFPNIRPKLFSFELACSPTSIEPYHAISSNTIGLKIDLREPTLVGHTIMLYYRINLAVNSNGGNTFPSSGQPETFIHPGGASSAQFSFDINGQTMELSKSLPGGQEGLVQDFASLVSGGLGPFFTGNLEPINLTAFIGSIVSITIQASCTLDSDTRDNPFLPAPHDGSVISGIFQLTC